jgi:hypothetical protein
LRGRPLNGRLPCYCSARCRWAAQRRARYLRAYEAIPEEERERQLQDALARIPSHDDMQTLLDAMQASLDA